MNTNSSAAALVDKNGETAATTINHLDMTTTTTPATAVALEPLTTEIISDGNQNQCQNGHINDDDNGDAAATSTVANTKLMLSTIGMLKIVYNDLADHLTTLQQQQQKVPSSTDKNATDEAKVKVNYLFIFFTWNFFFNTFFWSAADGTNFGH